MDNQLTEKHKENERNYREAVETLKIEKQKEREQRSKVDTATAIVLNGNIEAAQKNVEACIREMSISKGEIAEARDLINSNDNTILFTKNSVLYKARKIVTPYGTFTGAEFYEELGHMQDEPIETTLSALGIAKIKGDYIANQITNTDELIKSFSILDPTIKEWCTVIL